MSATPLTTVPRFGGGLVVLEADAIAARPSNTPWSAAPIERSRTAHQVTRPRPDVHRGAVEILWIDGGTAPARFRNRASAERAAAIANRRT